MTTGDNPWKNIKIDNYIQALLKIGTTNEVPSIPDTISIELKQFIEVCLIRDQSKRPKLSDLKRMPFLSKNIL